MMNYKFRNAFVSAMVAVLLGGCASTPADKTAKPEAADASAAAGVAVSGDPKAPLERRATDRWKLLIAKDAARAYTYLTPGYRQQQSAAEYVAWVNTRQVSWVSAQYQDHHCESPQSCAVGLQLTVSTKLRGVAGEQQATTYISERWLQVDGVWYYFPKGSD